MACALACCSGGLTCRLQTFDQLYIKFICDNVPMSAWGRVKYSNTLAVVPAIVLGAVFREYGALKGYVLSSHAFAVLLLSCACGIALSYSAFHLRAQISATAFTVRSPCDKKARLLSLPASGCRDPVQAGVRAHKLRGLE